MILCMPSRRHACGVLYEMIAYYSVDPIGRRCTNEKGVGVLVSNDGLRLCMVAMMLFEPEDMEKIYGTNRIENINGIIACDQKFRELFKPKYRGFPIRFYRYLETLHDTEKFWNKSGLTESGEGFVRKIEAWISTSYPREVSVALAA